MSDPRELEIREEIMAMDHIGIAARILELETAVKIERKHAYGDGHMGASIELHSIIQERDARISELEAIIKAAPHEEHCASWDGACDCWKSKAKEAAQ